MLEDTGQISDQPEQQEQPTAPAPPPVPSMSDLVPYDDEPPTDQHAAPMIQTEMDPQQRQASPAPDGQSQEQWGFMPDWSTPGHLLTGAGKGLVRAGEDIGGLASYVVPKSWSEAVAGSDVVKKAQEFADKPGESYAEKAGIVAGEAAPWFLQPEAGLARIATGVGAGLARAGLPIAERIAGAGAKAVAEGTWQAKSFDEIAPKVPGYLSFLKSTQAKQGVVKGAADILAAAAGGGAGAIAQSVGEEIRSGQQGHPDEGHSITDLVYAHGPEATMGAVLAAALRTAGMAGHIPLSNSALKRLGHSAEMLISYGGAESIIHHFGLPMHYLFLPFALTIRHMGWGEPSVLFTQWMGRQAGRVAPGAAGEAGAQLSPAVSGITQPDPYGPPPAENQLVPYDDSR